MASESAQKVHSYSKGDVRYWQERVRKVDSPDFSIQIAFQGRRHRFPLATSVKDTAGKKGLAIYQMLRSSGWEATMAKFKPESATRAKGSTVGELIDAVSELASVRPSTLRSYVTTFRRMVADMEGIEATAGRFARCGEGRNSWLGAVNAVPLKNLTPDRVEAWKLKYVSSRSKGNEVRARAARNSANSLLRMGKGLFAKRLLRLVANRIVLPSPLPFEGVDLFPRQSMRYVSTIDVKKLVTEARRDLAANDPEAFKAFLLGLFGGLRRNEADKLRWKSIRFDDGVIRVEAHADFAPKAETSLGDVPIDTEVVTLLRGLWAREPEAEYVLAGDESKMNATWADYRAEATFQRLVTWLRKHGVKGRTPLHTLRKEAGSQIMENGGLFDASRFLRHADVAITAQHYVAQNKRITVGLGGYLAGDAKNIVQFSSKSDPGGAKGANARSSNVRSKKKIS